MRGEFSLCARRLKAFMALIAAISKPRVVNRRFKPPLPDGIFRKFLFCYRRVLNDFSFLSPKVENEAEGQKKNMERISCIKLCFS